MATDLYRYEFNEAIPANEIETTLVLTLVAVESLHGESQTRLDAGHAFDAKQRSAVIDASTEVGRDFNRVFVGLISREFGAGSFRVKRVHRSSQPEPVAA